jgi:hypothetical protein
MMKPPPGMSTKEEEDESPGMPKEEEEDESPHLHGVIR